MDPSAVRFNASSLPSNMSLSAHLRELAYVRRNPIEGSYFLPLLCFILRIIKSSNWNLKFCQMLCWKVKKSIFEYVPSSEIGLWTKKSYWRFVLFHEFFTTFFALIMSRKNLKLSFDFLSKYLCSKFLSTQISS